MSTLLKTLLPRKNRTYGFVVVDRKTGKPLELTKGGLFMPAREASFFRIIERKHGDFTRTTHRHLDYVACRNRVEKAIARHHRIVARMKSSSLSRDWSRTKAAAAVAPKIQPFKTNPL